MENTAPRFNASSIIAACIVAAALIASALIVSHRPAAGGSAQPTSIPSAKPVAMPPIGQESAQEQFRAQVLAAPTLRTFLYGGKTYTLTDVKVTRVLYTAKDDDFLVSYDWIWQPAMPPDGPNADFCGLSNDGYGHYYGVASISPAVGGTAQDTTDVTIK